MIFRAPEPPIEIPDVALTPFLFERAARWGTKPAFIDSATGRVLTFDAWMRDVRRFAASLAARGFGKGDVLAIYSANSPDYAIVFYGVALLGGIVTTINPLYTAEELRRQIDDCKAKYLVTQRPFVEKTKDLPVREIFITGEPSFESLIASDGVVPKADIDPANDVVALPYSSGTTGLPKGVMLTHRNIVANVLQSKVIGVRDEDVVLAFLPFFHIYGMVVIMAYGIYTGTTIVTMPRFDLEQSLQLAEKHRVTLVYVVPPIFIALRSPVVGKYDISSVRTLFSGAAPLSAGVAAEAANRFHCEVIQGYGMTEASPVTHVMRRGDTFAVGKLVPNTEGKIVDIATQRELGPNE